MAEPYDYIWGFAVAAVGEGLALREAGIAKPILVLGYTFEEDYPAMIKNGIRPAVFTMKMQKSRCCCQDAGSKSTDPYRSRHRHVPHRFCGL